MDNHFARDMQGISAINSTALSDDADIRDNGSQHYEIRFHSNWKGQWTILHRFIHTKGAHVTLHTFPFSGFFLSFPLLVLFALRAGALAQYLPSSSLQERKVEEQSRQ